MVVGPVHEGSRGLLDMSISEVAEGIDLDFHPLGATTKKRQEVCLWVESDLSFCFDATKVSTCLPDVSFSRP